MGDRRMKLTTREKAKLFDELRSMARYEEPVDGVHNGWHSIIVTIDQDSGTCPHKFTSALKATIRENKE